MLLHVPIIMQRQAFIHVQIHMEGHVQIHVSGNAQVEVLIHVENQRKGRDETRIATEFRVVNEDTSDLS